MCFNIELFLPSTFVFNALSMAKTYPQIENGHSNNEVIIIGLNYLLVSWGGHVVEAAALLHQRFLCVLHQIYDATSCKNVSNVLHLKEIIRV